MGSRGMTHGKGPGRPKHQPLRTCLGCGQKKPKRELVRVVRTPSGAIEVDPTGRKAGRGAYVCPGESCLRTAVRGRRLERALEVAVPEEVLDLLAKAVSDGTGRVAEPSRPVETPRASRVSPPGTRSGRDPLKG